MRRISCDSRRSVSERQSPAKCDATQRIVAVEEIDAGRLGQPVEDIGRQLRRQARNPEDPLDRLGDRLLRHLAIERLDERPEGTGVAERPMTIGDDEAMPRDDRVEPVTVRIRKQPARQPDRAQRTRRKRPPHPGERVLEEPVVETRIVSDEDTIGQALFDVRRDGRKGRGAGHHGIGNAGQRLDHRRNRHFRVDQRTPLVDRRRAACRIGIHPDDADFGDPVIRRPHAGGFQVDEGERRCKELHCEGLT